MDSTNPITPLFRRPATLAALAVLLAAILVGLSLMKFDSGAGAAATGSGPQELDFGFVELDPGQPMPIPSYRNGGNMLLFAGEEFSYQVVAEAPVPPIELRLGNRVLMLSAAGGKLTIEAPPKQGLSPVLFAQGSRTSLPGGAPPRIAVKVQVSGSARAP